MNKKICESYNGIRLIHIWGEIAPDFWEEFPHSHEHCEVFLHLSGELDIFVEQNLYHLSGGEARVYRTNELHFGKTERTQYMEWFQLSVPKDFFDIEENAILGKAFFQRNAGEGNVFIPEKFIEGSLLLKEAINSNGELAKHHIYSAAIKLLCFINEENCTSVSDIKNAVLKQLTETINQNFKQISTVEDLGRLTHYSTSYINSIFKKELNVTPYRFIISKKLNEAKNAIKSGMNITDSCEYAGFNNYANFITLFKKHFGTTPKQWIKSRSTKNDK